MEFSASIENNENTGMQTFKITHPEATSTFRLLSCADSDMLSRRSVSRGVGLG